jgi:hypothetical protein
VLLVGNGDTLSSDGDYLFCTIRLPATSTSEQAREKRGVKGRLVYYSLQKSLLLFVMWDCDLMFILFCIHA